MKIVLSNLPKLWLIDLDGTLVKHNGYKEGKEELLPGAKEFINSIPASDKIIILTSRNNSLRETTENFLKENGIKYDLIIFDLPLGERILINDLKPSGLQTAYAINLERDKGINIKIVICGGL